MQCFVCYILSLSYFFFVHNENTARKRQFFISKDDLTKSFNLKAREQKCMYVCVCARAHACACICVFSRKTKYK